MSADGAEGDRSDAGEGGGTSFSSSIRLCSLPFDLSASDSLVRPCSSA